MDHLYVVFITLVLSLVALGIAWEIVEDYSVSNPGPTEGSIEREAPTQTTL